MPHKHRKHSKREATIPVNYMEKDYVGGRISSKVEALKHRLTRHVHQQHRVQRVSEVLGAGVRKHRHHRLAGVRQNTSHVWGNTGLFPNVGNVTTVLGSRFAQVY